VVGIVRLFLPLFRCVVQGRQGCSGHLKGAQGYVEYKNFGNGDTKPHALNLNCVFAFKCSPIVASAGW
jgi:hypothetical protein